MPAPSCRQCMASVGANAHEQPRPAKWLRRLSWCSYCLRIAAYSCRVSTRVICATGPFMLASWWVPLLLNTRRINLSTVCNGCSHFLLMVVAKFARAGIGASPLPEMPAAVGRRYLGAWLPLAGRHGSVGKTVACAHAFVADILGRGLDLRASQRIPELPRACHRCGPYPQVSRLMLADLAWTLPTPWSTNVFQALPSQLRLSKPHDPPYGSSSTISLRFAWSRPGKAPTILEVSLQAFHWLS